MNAETTRWPAATSTKTCSEIRQRSSASPARHTPGRSPSRKRGCRNADGPYAAGQSFVLTVDGFLLSDNVEALDCAVTDLAFANSDHNPVILRFRLKV